MVMAWGKEFVVTTLKGKSNIESVTLLGSTEKIDWKMTADGLKITFPKIKPCEYVYSFKIMSE